MKTLILAQSDGAVAIVGAVYVALWVFGVILGIVWMVFPFSVTKRLDRLRVEAERQTALLTRIAEQTRPPLAPGAISSPAARYDPFAEEKSSFGTFIGVIVVIVILVGGAAYLIKHS